MRSIVIVLLATSLLSGCGTATGDRGLSGAGIGAGIGVIGGPSGMVVGGAIGSSVGMLTRPNHVNLGRPAWKS
jgi:osmotically inducible lipoprotein OsmB